MGRPRWYERSPSAFQSLWSTYAATGIAARDTRSGWGSRPRGASAFCSPMPISRPPSTRQRACSNGSRAGPIVAIGSRKTDGAAILVRQPWLREHLGKGFTFLTRALIADVSDATCGFKAFRGDVGRDLFAHCRIDGWGFDAELLLLARRSHYRVDEVAVRWEDRAGTKVNLLLDALRSFGDLLRIRLYSATGAYRRPSAPSEFRPRLAHPAGGRGESRCRGSFQAMNSRPQVARQRRFYGTRTHAHLRPRAGDHYAQKLARALALQIGLNSEDRILEVGAGFGRFTFDLLEWCGSMVALDLSARALSELEHTREERGISPERCSTLCADLTEPVPELPEAGFDAVVGFFLLHHLPDLKASIAVSAPLLQARRAHRVHRAQSPEPPVPGAGGILLRHDLEG